MNNKITIKKHSYLSLITDSILKKYKLSKIYYCNFTDIFPYLSYVFRLDNNNYFL